MSNDDELAVVIGATPKERVPAKVCARSVLYRASCHVRVIHCYNREFSCPPGPTGFSFQRFATPDLVGRKGRALYLDSDMIILGDVRELLEKDLEGFDCIIPEAQAAVLLMDAGTVKFSLPVVVAQMHEGRTSRNKVMMLREGMCGTNVGTTLGEVWNTRDKMHAKTKNLHYTNMTNQPWLRTRPFRHPYADVWFRELRFAVEENLIPETDIIEDVSRGHLHEECLGALAC